MQGWSLDRKIQVTQTRILEWFEKWNNEVYVSFSGGKDSTVLADLAARICKVRNCKLVLWFSDTGLEYPEVREHVKQFPNYLEEKYGVEVELIIDYPKDKNGKRIIFRDVITSEGYPIISKEVALKIKDARRNPNGYSMQSFVEGSPKNIKYPKFKLVKYKYLLDAPFEISHKCCDIMKKKPSKQFEKERKLHPIIGTMTCESNARRTEWLKHGCNAFDNKRPMSRPISFWTEQDVLRYLNQYKIPYPSIYGDIVTDENGYLKTTGCDRTGCMYCGFGCHLEKEPNRFQKLKETHPKIREYCMKPVKDGGLGMKEVLEYIGVKIE
jgi:3'-phosphoadenosine 5'-phosphosulfate sulfotransferase (PAPS reductase)/FAD synthetase